MAAEGQLRVCNAAVRVRLGRCRTRCCVAAQPRLTVPSLCPGQTGARRHQGQHAGARRARPAAAQVHRPDQPTRRLQRVADAHRQGLGSGARLRASPTCALTPTEHARAEPQVEQVEELPPDGLLGLPDPRLVICAHITLEVLGQGPSRRKAMGNEEDEVEGRKRTRARARGRKRTKDEGEGSGWSMMAPLYMRRVHARRSRTRSGPHTVTIAGIGYGYAQLPKPDAAASGRRPGPAVKAEFPRPKPPGPAGRPAAAGPPPKPAPPAATVAGPSSAGRPPPGKAPSSAVQPKIKPEPMPPDLRRLAAPPIDGAHPCLASQSAWTPSSNGLRTRRASACAQGRRGSACASWRSTPPSRTPSSASASSSCRLAASRPWPCRRARRRPCKSSVPPVNGPCTEASAVLCSGGRWITCGLGRRGRRRRRVRLSALCQRESTRAATGGEGQGQLSRRALHRARAGGIHHRLPVPWPTRSPATRRACRRAPSRRAPRGSSRGRRSDRRKAS